jgi:hypothetical protein
MLNMSYFLSKQRLIIKLRGYLIVIILSCIDIAGYCQSPQDTKEYYFLGKLKRETPYDKNNNRNGVMKVYYKSGKIQLETPYINGKIEGVATVG